MVLKNKKPNYIFITGAAVFLPFVFSVFLFRCGSRLCRRTDRREQEKKSNGYIAADSFELNDVSKARSLSVHADNAVASWHGIKLSEKQTKIDGIDAIEVIISSSYMIKWVYLKKDDMGYVLLYENTPAYFDEYLGVFDKFVESFKSP